MLKHLIRLRGGLPGTLVAQGITAVSGLVSGIILARTLGPAGRGDFVAVVLWPNILFLIGEMGLGFSFSYFAGKRAESVSGLFSLAIIVSIVPGVLLALAGWVILPQVLPVAGTTLLCLKLCLISVPFLLGSYHLGYILLGFNHIFLFNLVRLSAVLSYTVGIVAVGWWFGGSVPGYTAIYILSQIMGACLAFGLVIWRLRPRWTWPSDLLRQVFTYGLKTYAGSLASQANLRLDQTLMVGMVSSAQLGLYAVAVAAAGMLTPIFTALSVVVMPRVIHAATVPDGARRAINFVQMGVILAGPVALIVIVAAPWLLPVVFGDAFSSAVTLTQVLLIAALFHGTGIVLGNTLRSLGRPGQTALADVIGLVLTVAFLVILLPRMGAMGAAVTSLSVGGLVMTLQAAFVMRCSDLRLAAVINFRETLSFLCGAVRTAMIRQR